LGALGCALLVLASPATALPTLASPVTVPTLPKLPSVPTVPSVPAVPGVGELPIVPLPVDVALPVDVPLPVPPLPLDLAAPLSTPAVPDVNGLAAPLPVSADRFAATASGGEQLAPDGESAGTPAEGSQATPTSGLLRQPGTDSNPQGTRCFLATRASVAFAYECLSAARQRAPAVTNRAAQTTTRVEVAGVSLPRTGATILGSVVVAVLLFVVGVSLLRLRRRLGATRAGAG
jgi:hypothetical protein